VPQVAQLRLLAPQPLLQEVRGPHLDEPVPDALDGGSLGLDILLEADDGIVRCLLLRVPTGGERHRLLHPLLEVRRLDCARQEAREDAPDDAGLGLVDAKEAPRTLRVAGVRLVERLVAET
jgi:hypothetical protein